jgi:hypothetical protein
VQGLAQHVPARLVGQVDIKDDKIKVVLAQGCKGTLDIGGRTL